MIVRIDCVSRAILAHRNLDPVTTLSAYSRETGAGVRYHTDDFTLTELDTFSVPAIGGDTGPLTTQDAHCRLSDTVTLYGPTPSFDGTVDPLVMIHDVNIAETVAMAAVGLRLRDVMEVGFSDTLASLGDVRVTRIVNGDRRAEGGHAYVHIHLDPLWREIEATITEGVEA